MSGGYPIHALWSHPRSMSTAFERVMRERGDLDCLHEPFMYDYYIHRQVKRLPMFQPRPDHPVGYAAVRDMILRRADAGPVFLKDMSYYVMPHILDDHEFCRRVSHAFLVRDPVASIPSYYRLDPDMTAEEVGLEAQWQHFEALREMTGTAPVVMRSEDVRENPHGVISAYWRAEGLAFVAGAFTWSDKTPEDWEQVQDWHESVGNSRAIRPLTADERAAQTRRFEAAADEKPVLHDHLARHRPYYARFGAVALSAGDNKEGEPC